MKTVIQFNDTRKKSRARRIDLDSLARGCRAFATEKGEIIISLHDGGGVANCYGYPAQTMGAISVAFPSGDVVIKAAWFRAAKSGASTAAITEMLSPECRTTGYLTASEERRAAADEKIIAAAEKILAASEAE